MEENSENIIKEEGEDKQTNHNPNYGKLCIGVIIAAFIGGFLATYFIIDQIAERKLYSPEAQIRLMEKQLFDDIEKNYKREQRDLEELFNDKNFKMPENKHNKIFMPFEDNVVNINTKYDDNKFEVIIGLKPFDGDEGKIQYDISGRKLTIYGESQKKAKGYEENISFSQDFIMPGNAISDSIERIKEGQKLIIKIPISKN